VAQTFALIALVRRVLEQVSCSSKMVPNTPKWKETHENMSLGSSCMDRERRYEKFWHDFVARTFALAAPVWRVLQQVSCSSETVPNAPKRKEMHQNKSLRSNGVHREISLRKIMTQHYGTNFFINFTSLARFAASFVHKRNAFKCTKRKGRHQNMRLGSNGMDPKCSLWKILRRHHGMNFCINCTSLARFRAVAKRFQMHPNGKKRTKTIA
jgi:hypothetical protein